MKFNYGNTDIMASHGRTQKQNKSNKTVLSETQVPIQGSLSQSTLQISSWSTLKIDKLQNSLLAKRDARSLLECSLQ